VLVGEGEAEVGGRDRPEDALDLPGSGTPAHG
jgi:hypothetical protein